MKTNYLIFLSLGVCAFSGCTTVSGDLDRRPVFQETKFVSLTNDLTMGKSIGQVEAQACNNFVIGIPYRSEASLQNAMEKIHKETGTRYMTNVHSNWYVTRTFILKEECFVLAGEGFK